MKKSLQFFINIGRERFLRKALYITMLVQMSCAIGDGLLVQECENRYFLTLSEIEAGEVIINCEYDKQIELYLAWSRYSKPQNNDLADDVSVNGVKLLPYLMSHLVQNETIISEKANQLNTQKGFKKLIRVVKTN